MNSAKKTRPIPVMITETITLEITPLSVNTLKSFGAAGRIWFDRKLPNFSTLTTIRHCTSLPIELGRG